jgi:hypothetical protein
LEFEALSLQGTRRADNWFLSQAQLCEESHIQGGDHDHMPHQIAFGQSVLQNVPETVRPNMLNASVARAASRPSENSKVSLTPKLSSRENLCL